MYHNILLEMDTHPQTRMCASVRNRHSSEDRDVCQAVPGCAQARRMGAAGQKLAIGWLDARLSKAEKYQPGAEIIPD